MAVHGVPRGTVFLLLGLLLSSGHAVAHSEERAGFKIRVSPGIAPMSFKYKGGD